MSEGKHTPLPWRDCIAEDSKDICGGWASQKSGCPEGSIIQAECHTAEEAVVFPSRFDGSVWCLPEDREFIVRACNAHYDLLEACEIAQQAIKTAVAMGIAGGTGLQAAEKRLETTIKKARGKS